TMEVVFVIVLLGLLSVDRVECGQAIKLNSEYPAISCRKHSALLTEYGGIEDGKTSNIKAFKKAIDDLSKFSLDGANGTIDGQGQNWWHRYHHNKLNYTRPFLIELLYSRHIQISNLTLLNSLHWFVHPVYSSNIIIQKLMIIAPYDPVSPKTDGISPGTTF
ncbi:hypothetical protein IFM89_028588, partial [Coptis chinensis]